MSQQTTPEPIDPAALALLADGSMTVRQAAEWSGLSRTELFNLMRDGDLPWFRWGQGRMIPRKSLHEYLARLYAAHKQTTGVGARTSKD